MTLEWRQLEPGALDHERLWTSVLAACAATGLAMVYTLGVPPVGCLFKAVTGVPCLTCGFTRGCLALAAGDVLAAARWNPLVPLGSAGAIAYGSYAIAALLRGPERLRARLTAAEARGARWGAVLAAAAVWAWLILDGR